MCKGNLQDGYSTFTADAGKCIIIIKNVPAQICGQCGEVSYSGDVAQRLEQIVASITQTVITEIAVVNYSVKAA
jgi:YgiT-type zinc finger domain-containing protein